MNLNLSQIKGSQDFSASHLKDLIKTMCTTKSNSNPLNPDFPSLKLAPTWTQRATRNVNHMVLKNACHFNVFLIFSSTYYNNQ